MRGVGCARGCIARLSNVRSIVYSLAKVASVSVAAERITSTIMNAVGGRVFPGKRRTPARVRTCGHVAAPDPTPGGVSVLPPLRGPDSIWGSGAWWEFRAP